MGLHSQIYVSYFFSDVLTKNYTYKHKQKDHHI